MRLGDVTAALVAYQQTLAIDQALGYRHLAVETTADLARTALAQGNIAQASACVADILADLDNGTLAGTEEPVLVYLTCFQVLRAAGEPRAESVLAAGYALLSERAAQFDDPRRKSLFIDNLPAHRTLVAEWRDHRARAGDAGVSDAAGALPNAVGDHATVHLRILTTESSHPASSRPARPH